VTSPSAARFTNDRLFRILKRAIDHRRPKALIFDEAHHFLRLASSQSLVNQLEHLKYIADETKTLHVLFGTYELVKMMDLSSALIRRREVIHFPRYFFDPRAPAESLKAFAGVIAVFSKDLDAVCELELLKEVPYLYQGSVGCVGVLRDWLFRAYKRAERSKGQKITRRILDNTILAVSDRMALVEAALSGEAYFRDRSACESDYLTKLGFTLNGSSAPNTPKTVSRKRKPGTRNPHNDLIGTAHLSSAGDLAA
jgi:hypothetical protein